MENKPQETVQLSTDGRIVYCGAFLLRKMFESGCSDAEIALYMYYLLTMTANNNIVLNLPLEQIRKDLHWGQNKLVKTKGSLAKIGLIKNHTVRGKDGMIKQHRLVVFTGVNDAQITRSTETIAMETRLVEGKSERFPPAPPSNSNSSSLKPTSLTGNTISILPDTSFPNTDSPLRFPSGRSVVDGMEISEKKDKKAVTISPEEFISLLPDNCKGNAELETSCREFIQFRRESYPKEPFTALAARKALKRFVKIGRATPEELTESIDFAITKPWTCFFPRPTRANGFTVSNGGTKTSVQPNTNNIAAYWDRNLTQHTLNNRKPEDFNIYGCKTQSELLDRMAVRLDEIWKQTVGDVMWKDKENERPARLEFYRIQADAFLGYINSVEVYDSDCRNNMHENPMKLLDSLAQYLLETWGDAQFTDCNFKAVRQGSDKWWPKFVTWLENSWQINFTTGRKRQ